MEKTARMLWAILTSPFWIIIVIYGMTVGTVQIGQPKWIENLFKKEEK